VKRPVASPLITLVVAAVLAPCAVGSIIRDDGTDAGSLALAAMPAFAGTARISVAGGVGSGTLIAPGWVLTAAHVVTNSAGSPLPLGSLTITVNGESRAVAEVVVQPGWTGGNFTAGVDLALVRLSSDVTSVAPAGLFTGPAPVSAEAALVGYGAFGFGSLGFVQPPGSLHGATNTFDALGSALFPTWSSSLILMDFDSPTTGDYNRSGTTFATALEGVPATGDSGGGSFIFVDGAWLLAGVHSFTFTTTAGTAAPGGYGTGAADTLVSASAAWINSVIPTPSAAIPLLAAMAFNARRRRQ